MHQYGMIHCDIKPSNIIIITENGEIQTKIIDLGSAIQIGSFTEDVNNTIREHTKLYSSYEVLFDGKIE
jgi:serine/threonine protein kinase